MGNCLLRLRTRRLAVRMALRRFSVVLLLCVGMVRAVTQFKTSPADESCDFSGLDLDRMVNDIVSQLPAEDSGPKRPFDEALPGLFVGSLVHTGFDKLRPYGPLLPYCRNGSRLVQVDLATTEDLLKVSVPWKTCAGQKGTAETTTGARVTVTFEVARLTGKEGSTGATLVHHSGPTPVAVESVSVYLRGAGDILGGAVTVVGKLFPQMPKEFWLDVLTYRLRAILRGITSP